MSGTLPDELEDERDSALDAFEDFIGDDSDED